VQSGIVRGRQLVREDQIRRMMQPTRGQISHVKSMTNSYGDVWATAWADDDLLYSVSDDTPGFDGFRNSNLAISVLAGDSAEDLSGHTVNAMEEYGACNEEGPDGATWKANGLTCVDGVLYLSVKPAPVREMALLYSIRVGRPHCEVQRSRPVVVARGEL
jgi:hypothetical protein